MPGMRFLKNTISTATNISASKTHLHMTIHSSKDWNDIMQLCQQMQLAVDDGQWADITDMAVQRDRLLRDFFKAPVTEPTLAEQISKDITVILQMDQTIINQSNSERDRMHSEHRSHKKGARAIQQYEACIKG